MIPVSNEWLAASKERLLPEMQIEITYAVSEPGLQDSATITSNSEASFSETTEILTGTDHSGTVYATLEHNFWGLDGTFEDIDENLDNPGYVSEVLSGENGVFTDTPIITLSFSETHTTPIPGMTIIWSETFDEWATSFRIRAYGGSSVVAEKTVTDNTKVETIVALDIVNYNRITIEILSWSLPHRRARCVDLYLGAKKVYTKDDLLGYEHSQSADLLSAALPKNTITFRLRNENAQWNPDNPTGESQYLLDQQEIRVRYGMVLSHGVEWIEGGTFWLAEWDVPSNGMEASFTARDLLTFMNETYTGIKTGTLYEIAVAAFEQTYLPELSTGADSYYISPMLDQYTTSFESDLTVAEVLQMVAHAGGCVFYQDRNGTVRIEPWSAKYSDFNIDPDISYSHPEYTISKPLKAVSVGYGEDQRVLVSASPRGETQTVDNEMIRTADDAQRIGEKTRNILENRKVISGEFRADMRLDCLDSIIVTSKYASNIIAVTEVDYSTTGGAFRGRYTGRVVSVSLQSTDYYVGELYAGEV